MYEFQLNDPLSILGGSSTAHLSWARALKLMAYATAPSPGSRYQPGSNWSVAKYATAIDPRTASSPGQTAITNSGIRDLDPHQKTVLADDVGMGLSLAAIDMTYGIVGLWDCYSLWLEGLLQLVQSGRHRRMPDFLALLQKPISGSTMALLECKGSTRNTASAGQLTSACWQLHNVSSVLGIPQRSHPIPQVGIACMIHPGAPIELTVADPPEELQLPDDIEIRLRANYAALELAALGDVATADAVRMRYELPSWGRLGLQTDLLPRSEVLSVDQTMLSILPGRSRLPPKVREAVDLELIKKRCVVRTSLKIGPSRRATALKMDVGNEDALLGEAPRQERHSDGASTDALDGTPNAKYRRLEEDRAEDGSTSVLSLDIRVVPDR